MFAFVVMLPTPCRPKKSFRALRVRRCGKRLGDRRHDGMAATIAAAACLLREHRAGALLTGTSDVDEPTDRALWRAARGLGVTSHVILDQRVNLRQRFLDPDGRLTCPDWVYVSDEAFLRALVQSGLSVDRVRILGDVHLRQVRRKLATISAADVSGLRKAWHIEPDRNVVLFISECAREMAAAGRPAAYDEVQQVEHLISAIEARRTSAGRCLRTPRRS